MILIIFRTVWGATALIFFCLFYRIFDGRHEPEENDSIQRLENGSVLTRVSMEDRVKDPSLQRCITRWIFQSGATQWLSRTRWPVYSESGHAREKSKGCRWSWSQAQLKEAFQESLSTLCLFPGNSPVDILDGFTLNCWLKRLPCFSEHFPNTTRFLSQVSGSGFCLCGDVRPDWGFSGRKRSRTVWRWPAVLPWFLALVSSFCSFFRTI